MESVSVLPFGTHWAPRMNSILRAAPELLDAVHAVQTLDQPISAEHPVEYVLGGFGAIGIPSMFHHPDLRELRGACYEAVYPYFAQAFPGRKMEALFDRLSVRRKGTTTSAESWHRDVGGKPGDLILGGWLNLDAAGTKPQYFSGIPGDVLPLNHMAAGFEPFKREDTSRLNAALKAAGGPIAVPPGHIIIFNQTIAHKITGSTARETSRRLYLGWRITDDPEPLYNKAAIIAEQSVPPLPSGEKAPMYAKLHWVNWRDRLMAFSARFKPACIDPSKGCVYRDMPGLVALGWAFPAYTRKEQAIFYPRVLVAPEIPEGGDEGGRAKRARVEE